MIRPKKLRLQNFRSFLDATFVFPDTGLVLIRGKDTETGESSGTGKSAIFLGLAYALDILPPKFSGKALQSWEEDAKTMQVTLELQDGAKTIVLQRGKTTEVDFGNGTLKKGAKSYPEALREIFGLAPEVVQALTYRAQGQNSFFLSMEPAAMVEFLTRILHLDGIEAAVGAAQKKISELEPRLDAAQQVHSAMSAAYAQALEEQIPPEIDRSEANTSYTIAQLELNATQKRVGECEEALRQLNDAATILRTDKLRAKRVEVERAQAFLKQVQDAQDKTRATYRESEQRIRGQLRTLDAALLKVAQAEKDLKRTQAELVALSNDTCPTCEREWVTQQAIDLKAKVLQRCSTLETEARGRTAFEQQKAQLEAELAKAVVVPVDPRLEKLKAIEQKVSKELVEMEPPPDERVTHAQKNLHQALAGEQRALQVFRAAEMACREVDIRIKGRQDLISAMNRRREVADRQRSDAANKMLELQREQNAEKDFVGMMGREGFLGLIFEEILQEIARETNIRLGRLANTSGVRIDFQTESDTGRRKIQTWVDVRGHRGQLETACSGGMQTSVAQIIDLAVVTVIGRRVGGTLPGWMCLDEVTDGQGPVTKESALEVLRESAEDRLVLVIDHGTEFKESFNQTIDIEFTNGVSKVAV